MSNLRQNEPPGGTMLERRWSPPQAQKPSTGGHYRRRYVHQQRRRKKYTTNLHFKKPKKLDSPRLQLNGKLRVRQYIISDPSNVYYIEYYTSLKETSSADGQKQMKTPPTSHTTLDPMSNRLQHDTTTISVTEIISEMNDVFLHRA